jgi:ssDNA-binding Zn-finger/Zn-ribbon topoisomerase 1
VKNAEAEHCSEHGKFGRFIGCEKYPDCDYIKNISFGVKCPKCKEGDIVERKSKEVNLSMDVQGILIVIM